MGVTHSRKGLISKSIRGAYIEGIPGEEIGVGKGNKGF
jgi:hypothetical protein